MAGLRTTPPLPASSISAGFGSPSPSGGATDVAGAFANFYDGIPSAEPAAPQSATVSYNPASKEVFVAGFGKFAADDETSAANSFGHVQKNTKAPIPDGFTPLDTASYAGHVNEIIDPGIMRLAQRGFGSGIDQAKQLGGYGLKFLGAEQTGQGVIDSATKSLNKTSVYSSEFTDTGAAGGEKSVLNWFVYNLAQQGPNLLAFLGASMLGGAAGGAAYGTAAGARAASVAGRIGGLLGKAEYQTAVTSAAERYAAAQALPAAERAVAMKSLADVGEIKLLKEASSMVGAAIASGTLNYGMGVSSITQEQEESGSGRNRLTALAAAVPWAAMESLPEFAGMATLFGKIMTSKPGLKGRAIGAAKAGAVLGGLEGVTNASQDLIQMAVTKPGDIATPEGGKRLLNSFVAGAAVGGPLGAAAHAISPYVPHDLLNRDTINAVNNRDVPQQQSEMLALPPPQRLLPPPFAGPSTSAPGEAVPNMTGGYEPINVPPTGMHAGSAPINMEPTARPALMPPAWMQGLHENSGPFFGPDAVQQDLPMNAPQVMPDTRGYFPLDNTEHADAQQAYRGLTAGMPAPVPVTSSEPDGRVGSGYRRYEYQPIGLPTASTAAAITEAKRVADNAVIQRRPLSAAPQNGILDSAPTPSADNSIIAAPQQLNLDLQPVMPKRARLTQAGRAAARRRRTSGQPERATQANPEPAATQQAEKPNKIKAIAAKKKSGDNSKNVTQQPAAPAPKSEKTERPRKTAAKASSEPATKVEGTTASVPFMITAKMKADLAARGYSSDDIRNMTPMQANEALAEAKAEAPKAETLKKGKAAEAAATKAHRDAWVQAEPGKMTPEAAATQYDALSPERKQDWAKARVRPAAKLDAVRETILRAAATETKRAAVAKKLMKGATRLPAPKVNTEGLAGEVISGPATTINKPRTASTTVQKTKAEPVKQTIAATDVDLTDNLTDFQRERIKIFNGLTAALQDKLLTVGEYGTLQNYINALKSVTTVSDGQRFELVHKTAMLSGNMSLANWNTRDGFVDMDTGKPAKAMPAGQVRLAVKAFVGKLRIKPKAFVYHDQSDLKAKNPALYARAVAARQQGDFDVADAAGYAFGDGNIIIFSGRILSPKHLKFVLAHETLGHYGLRSLLPHAELSSALNQIYDRSLHAQQAVDAAMAATGMPKMEAIEEYLSDFAGSIETNLIERIGAMIKNALNKLGFKFDDDITRYLLDQSKRYVRFGQPAALTGSFFDPIAMGTRLTNIEQLLDPDGSGRFITVSDPMADLVGMQDMVGTEGPALTKAVKLWRVVTDTNINMRDKGKATMSFLHTFGRLARENPGLKRFYDIINRMHNKLKEMRDTFNHLREITLARERKLGGVTLRKGLNKEEVEHLKAMLFASTRHKNNSVTLADVRAIRGSLVTSDIHGNVTENLAVIEKLEALGRITFEEFRDGFDLARFSGVPMTQEAFDALTAKHDALIKAAATPEAVAKAKKDKSTALTNRRTKNIMPQPFPGIPSLTRDGLLWKAYLEHFGDGMNSSMVRAAVELARAEVIGSNVKQRHTTEKLASAMGRDLTDAEAAFIRTLVERYVRLYEIKHSESDGVIEYDPDSVDNAGKMIIAFNKAIIGESTDRIADSSKEPSLASFFSDKTGSLETTSMTEADITEVMTSLRENSRLNSKTEKTARFDAQHLLLNMGMAQQVRDSSDMQSKLNIARNYLPIVRRGDHSVRVSAIDANGKIVKVADEFSQMEGYWQKNDKAAAMHAMERLNEEFAGMGPIQMRVMVGSTYEYAPVTFRAAMGTVLKDGTVPSASNLNVVLNAISVFNVHLSQEKRADIITAVTKTGDSSRKSLERRDNPGGDLDMIRAASEYLQNASASIARRIYRPEIDMLFDDDVISSKALWFGDDAEYDRRKAAHEADPDDVPAKYAFHEYHYMMKTNDSKRTGNTYKSIAMENMLFLDSQKNSDTTDFAGKGIIRKIRQATAVAQMGLSIATGAIQLVALQTNVVPALASYNQKRAFGGGFGIGKAHVAVYQALKQITFPGASDSATWKAMLTDKALRDKRHFSLPEVQYLFEEIQAGRMQAAQADAQGANARGDGDSKWQDIAQIMMTPFNIAEQASRRAAGLAAFRLEYAKQTKNVDMSIDANVEKAYKNTEAFANKMIDDTLGQYALGNIPRAFQNNIGHLVFMYKVFPVTTAELMMNLDYKGKIWMLGSLVLMAGIHGIPFADDWIDMLETISQRVLGLPIGSVEAEFYAGLEKVAPGLGNFMRDGGLNKLTGMSIGPRVAGGDVIPGTGALTAGADIGREMTAIAGPVMSFITQSISTVKAARRFAGDPTLNKAIDVLRVSPAASARAMGDTWMYYNTGAIVDRRGYIASKDLGTATMIGRLLGFYPNAAKEQNDIVRLNKTAVDYAKEISAAFKVDYVKAMQSKDPAGARHIMDNVNEWNKNARWWGSGLEIKNFNSSAAQAWRDAQMTTLGRAIKSAPKSSRNKMLEQLRMAHINPRGEPVE